MMRILIVGMGNMGSNHLRVLERIATDRQINMLIRTCDNKDSYDYKDYKVAVDDFKPTHIIIATPTDTHTAILEYCDGVVPNVLVEKPITNSPKTAKKYRKHKSNIMVGHIERYNPVVLTTALVLENKKIETAIAVRSGILSDRTSFDLDTDLCIHDVDVIRFLTKGAPFKESKLCVKYIGANTCNMFCDINGTVSMVHADTHSPYKVRKLKLMGMGFIIEADYLNQTLLMNGKEIKIDKEEPLELELLAFLDNKYTQEDLDDAIDNVCLVMGDKK